MHEWVSVGEASRRLNVSPSTIRRMIEAGSLMGEREQRGGKDRYRVKLPQDTRHDAPPSESPDASAASDYALRASEGLLALVREMRQQGVKDAEQIAGLMRQLGAAEAERDLLHERILDLERQRTDFKAWLDEAHAEVERLKRRPWWRRIRQLWGE